MFAFRFLAFFLFFVHTLPAQDVQIYSTLKTGMSSVNTSKLRAWSSAQGATDVVGRADNMMLVWDFGAVLKRTYLNMSLEYDLGSRRFTKPTSSMFYLGGGYALKQTDQLDVILAGSLGVGNLRTRFRGQIPYDLWIHHIASDCFARQIVMMGQPALILNLKPTFGRKDYFSGGDRAGVIISMKVGTNLPLIAGNWRYGRVYEYRNSSGDTSTEFVGERVNMPNFYKMAFFIQIGVGFVLMGH